MGIVCMLIIAVLYLLSAADSYFQQNDKPMAGVLACYAIANLLLIIVAYREH